MPTPIPSPLTVGQPDDNFYVRVCLEDLFDSDVPNPVVEKMVNTKLVDSMGEHASQLVRHHLWNATWWDSHDQLEFRETRKRKLTQIKPSIKPRQRKIQRKTQHKTNRKTQSHPKLKNLFQSIQNASN